MKKEMTSCAEAKTSAATLEKRVYTIDEIMGILNIGRNAAHALVNSQTFHSVRVGGIYRISKRSFDNWLDGRKGGEI